MVQQSLGNSGRYLNAEWHDKREQARTETFNIGEWGDIDRTRYDLDTVEFDRKKKASTFILRPTLHSEGSAQVFDLRDDETLHLP